MAKNKERDSAERMERRQANLAKHARQDRIWTIVMLVIAVAFFVTVIAIQVSHHL
jgi:hypothetical protein